MNHNHTPVLIIGAGPAGLTLSHLLHLDGVESIVLEKRSREEVEGTIRAGILEPATLDLMKRTGVGDRVAREGIPEEGIEISVDGNRTRIDLYGLTGKTAAIYPQHEFLKDFISRRLKDKGTILFNTTVRDIEGEVVTIETPAGEITHIRADHVVAADGSASPWRQKVAEVRARHEYPYAWFGLLVEAPPTHSELIYATHPAGFALISKRNENVQRYYLQCDPNDQPEDWPEERIWEQLHLRADSNGITVSEGNITEKAVLRFRSAVTEPMQRGNLYLAGDSAHTVPPTGAKGLNLAVADVEVLAPGLIRAVKTGHTDLLDKYTEFALPNVWRAQQFSWWMSSLLHATKGENHFSARRRIAQLRSVLDSEAGRRFLAEQYVGTQAKELTS
ncbi:4-hydroxybenzoate 3-monooxygenase [Corynebacterium sp. 3HC-13]|uniref:4-hydroxybenzoate 3-monooxygenase n=1 Tax=Corynebacterium poyangense TaxID=2684405 RepID=UPI001CCDDD20|nr:4-hydroxybenzoate 3-monooxygenase [Corynebacterium poyangense]MBZ8178293.1 4-hydroxybenzoate 3-monooxygenase [Corynebacterium poyangense]